MSPELELMRNRILAAYVRDDFSGVARPLSPQEHSRVRGTSGSGLLSLTYSPTLNPSP